MTSLIGVNASGHEGWIRFYCRICNKKMRVGTEPIYFCPKCAQSREAYFCLADYKKLKGKCPYCDSELQLYL